MESPNGNIDLNEPVPSGQTQRLNGHKTMQIRVDKIASVCHRLNLHKEEQIITEGLVPEAGHVTVVRSLGEKTVYGELELEEGRMAKIFENDYIIGALGARNALKLNMPTASAAASPVRAATKDGARPRSPTSIQPRGTTATSATAARSMAVDECT